ncbi:Ig-like domain-containing protein [Corallococcus coralloides]|uniref:Ig-like domain-containing protein n=1 Tax=Corallococcus coralloides TaxID=184914 RepID=UPI00384BEE2F
MTTSSHRLLVGALAALCLNARATAEASPLSTAVSPRQWAAALPDAPLAPVILTPTLGLVLSTALPFYSGTAEVGAKVTLSVDGKVTATVTADANGRWSYTPSLLELLSNGVHTLVAVSTNVAGQTGPAASVQFSVLALGPETVILSGPAPSTAQQQARFVFASSALLVSYQCALDSDVFVACDTPRDFTGLAEGPHQFQVRSKDLLGLLTDTTPATYSWTVDLTPPKTTFTSTPSAFSNAVVAAFAFESSETPFTFTCSLDSGPVLPCASPYLTVALGDGPHTLAVRARDAAGNQETEATTFTWTVDTVAPATPVVTSLTPGATVAVTPSEVSGRGEPGSVVHLTVDAVTVGTAEVDVSGQWTVALPGTLVDGVHLLTASATDDAGNASLPVTVSFTLDSTGADTRIVSGPPLFSASSSATFGFTSENAGATFRCQMDSLLSSACTSPSVYQGLEDGVHVFSVQAIAPNGLPDLTPAVHTWTVDTVAPVVTLVTSPPPVLAGTVASFGFAASEALATFQCSVDGVEFQACLANVTLEDLLPGTHTLQVRAVDAAGNIGVAVSYTWEMTPADGGTGGGTGTDGGTGTGTDGGITDAGTDAGTGGTTDPGTTDPGPGTGNGQTPDDSGVLGGTPDDELLGGGLGCGATSPAPAMWAGALLAGLMARARRRKS